MLVPELRPGDVVVFDNLKPHLSRHVAESIERAGATVLPLPPYSSDYDPIEELWSKFKEQLRRIAVRTKDGLYKAVGETLDSVTIQDILGWFNRSGLSRNSWVITAGSSGAMLGQVIPSSHGLASGQSTCDNPPRAANRRDGARTARNEPRTNVLLDVVPTGSSRPARGRRQLCSLCVREAHFASYKAQEDACPEWR